MLYIHVCQVNATLEIEASMKDELKLENERLRSEQKSNKEENLLALNKNRTKMTELTQQVRQLQDDKDDLERDINRLNAQLDNEKRKVQPYNHLHDQICLFGLLGLKIPFTHLRSYRDSACL